MISSDNIQNWIIVKDQNFSIDRFYTQRMEVLRFLSICSIVWGHCSLGWNCSSPYSNAVSAILVEAGKIGTVIFFIISGFFLAEKLNHFTVVSYLKHRLHTILLPWFFFLTLFVAIEVAHQFPAKNVDLPHLKSDMMTMLTLFKVFVFHSSFWFIPMSISSACVLVALKKYINSFWLGSVFLIITLFYSINFYFEWLPVNHTRAFAGYNLFMWIGIQLKAHLATFDAVLRRISLIKLLAAAFLLAFATCIEGIILKSAGSADPFASLRMSNSALSIFILLVICKTNKMSKLILLNPQAFVYGIYLCHNIFTCEIFRLLHINPTIKGHLLVPIGAATATQTIVFIMVMLASYFLVYVFRVSPLHLLVGCNKKAECNWLNEAISHRKETRRSYGLIK